MHYIILVLLVVCAICMLKLNIENLFKVFVILCANLFISFLIAGSCLDTADRIPAMIFFVVDVLLCTGILFWRLQKNAPSHKERMNDPEYRNMNLMDRLFKE